MPANLVLSMSFKLKYTTRPIQRTEINILLKKYLSSVQVVVISSVEAENREICDSKLVFTRYFDL